MKTLLNLVLVTAVILAVPAFATSYSCKGVYTKKIKFDLNVGTKQVVLSTANATCKALVDLKYHPTQKYAGYSRFILATRQSKTCRGLAAGMLGDGNSFDSIKVSSELLNGKDRGAATFIYDYGDYHGQLANDYVKCIAN